MNQTIFREYDIRGVFNQDELSLETALLLGKAIGTKLRRKNILRMTVGRDVRKSSDQLYDALLKGLLSTGVHVVDVGICPTPLLYFSLYHLDIQGGVMITGSHNPPEYNGFKICVGKETIHGEEIQSLYRMASSQDFITGQGTQSAEEIISPYISHLISSFPGLKGGHGLKVVIDSGNATAGLVAPELFKKFGLNLIEMYSEIDGNFPNHHPDPTVEKNLRELIQVVKKENADVGIAYDGDSDRIGVVDEKGNILWGDKLLILYARDILKHQPKATIVSEVKCSHLLYEDIQSRGGTGVMWKAGHSLIKAKMKETKAALGGEMSGHIFFADRYYGFDDAIYASCRLLEILITEKKKLSTLLSDLPETFSTPEIRVDCPDATKFEIVKRLREHLSSVHKIIDVDGVRVLFDDGWGLVRASNTQPILVLRFEATTRKRLTEIQHEIESALEDVRKRF
ncbi:MAG: phosphomannomutase/phosphoglucomutase [Nitrospirae bacterium]|nr:phosphomannomutase/phosphoglucomutase [Nitrospirota bacterium]MBI3593555.1 phosphomannomutase/phosphoglucomutase [Nitrospirota bacterium]